MIHKCNILIPLASGDPTYQISNPHVNMQNQYVKLKYACRQIQHLLSALIVRKSKHHQDNCKHQFYGGYPQQQSNEISLQLQFKDNNNKRCHSICFMSFTRQQFMSWHWVPSSCQSLVQHLHNVCCTAYASWHDQFSSSFSLVSPPT